MSIWRITLTTTMDIEAKNEDDAIDQAYANVDTTCLDVESVDEFDA